MPRFDATYRAMPSLFARETDSDSQDKLLHLIILDNIKSATATENALCLVDSNYDIQYTTPVSGTQVFSRFPIKFSGVSISTDGAIDKASITVSNVSREIMRLLEDYDGLAGSTVSVITVYEKFVDKIYSFSLDGAAQIEDNPNKDISAHIRDEYIIDSYNANEQAIVFQLDAVVNFNIKVPSRRFTPFSCYWRYRDPSTCGYGSDASEVLSSCDKSLTDCKKHARVGQDAAKGNTSRFGGFPGVPSDIRRLYL